MNFQPSELAKVVLPLYGAHFIAENLRLIPQLKDLSFIKNFKLVKQILLPAGIIGSILLLVFAGHDLGTTVLLASAMISLAFCGGIPKRILACCVVLAMIGLTVFLLNDPERISRITSIGQMDSEEVRQGDGYQLWNSLLALGSGGWNGIGFMESRMKNRYLPDHHTDFILAVVGEEIGFLGLLGVILAYLCFGFFGMKIALNSRSRFGMLLAQTLTVIIVLQAGINIGVISGGLPTKGLTAPLISYGGSNLLINMIMVGLIISVGLENVPGLTDKWPLRKKEEQ
jgi:cell division protein FtsW